MKLSDLRPAKGAKKSRKRVGRGPSSGHGKTSCRGHKGAGQRAGSGGKRAYEGGQNPLIRRLPKRGFVSRNRVRVQEVNLDQLRRFEAGATVDRATLCAAKVISTENRPVKVLANGEIDRAINLKVDHISEAARKKIESAGGSVEIIPPFIAKEGSSSEASA